MILWGLVLFIIANIGFESGLVFYDSFLPELTTPKNYGRVSGYGFAMGYLGSLVTLAIVIPFIKADLIRETFPVSALFFLIFSIPFFVYQILLFFKFWICIHFKTLPGGLFCPATGRFHAEFLMFMAWARRKEFKAVVAKNRFHFS